MGFNKVRVMKRSSLKAISFFLLILVWIASGQQQVAQAGANILVNTTVDELNTDGDCSLREAIRAANTDLPVDACQAGSGADTITLPTGLYALAIAGRNENLSATGDLDITGGLVISGADEAVTLINGNGLDRVFEIFGPAAVTISEVTIQGGNPGTSAGGPEVYGGGISIFGNATLTMNQATLQNNTAYQGGGLENNGGVATLSQVRISQNSASYMGGIHSTGTLHLIECTIQGNTSTFYSAGVHSEYSLILEKSTVSGNIAGTNGGGLYIHSGTAEILNSTVSGNQISGYQGGGIWVYYQAHVNITNSTISNNAGGGGVYNYHEGPGGPLQDPNIYFINTLLSSNTYSNCAKSTNAPPYGSLGHNLDSGQTCSLGGPGDLTNTPASLGLLQENGGPTLTHALLGGSLAIDAGDNTGCPMTDQRGVLRPQGGTCDIGAYERIPSGEANLSLTKADSVDPVILGNYIEYNLTVTNLGPDSAASTTLIDNLPAGVSFVSATPSTGSCGHSAGVVTCNLGTIVNAGSATLQIVVTADTSGVKVNDASVSSTTADPNTSNNSASASTAVNIWLVLPIVCRH